MLLNGTTAWVFFELRFRCTQPQTSRSRCTHLKPMRPRCTHLQPFAPDVRILHFSVQMYAIFNFCGAYIWTANFAARMRTSGTQGSSLRSRCTHLSLVQLRTSRTQTSPRGCVYLERKVEVCGPDARNFHLAYQMYVSSTFSFHMYAYNSFVSPRPHTHNRPHSAVNR